MLEAEFLGVLEQQDSVADYDADERNESEDGGH